MPLADWAYGHRASPQDRGDLAYAEYSGGQLAITATTPATAQLIVAAPPLRAPSGEFIYIEFFAVWCPIPASPAGRISVTLFEDGVAIGNIAQSETPQSGAGGNGAPLFGSRRLPYRGNHVYDVRAWVSGSGTPSGSISGDVGGPGVALPSYIRVYEA